MYKIRIKGKAQTDYNKINELDGISYYTDFVDYIDDDFGALTRGIMRFEVIDGELYTITDYDSNRELTEDELFALEDYTQGQWSDGIGEGFEQQPCHYDNRSKPVYVSPWYSGQTIDSEQIKIG